MFRFSLPIRTFALLLAQFAFVMAASTALASGPVVNPWVSTDRSVNTYDASTLAASMRRGATGQKEQAVNFYRFYRRAMYPYANRNEYPFPVNDQSNMFDFVRMVNVYGYTLCTQGNWMFASFLKETGLTEDARGISVPGHGTAEAFWDGKWHFIDAVVGCFAYAGKDRKDIASIDQIIADSTILSRAALQGRASMPFCPGDGDPIYPEAALAVPDQWFTYRKYQLAFLLGALPEYTVVDVGERASHTMAFELRPGFKLIRMWDHEPRMYNLSYEFHRNNLSRSSPSPAILPPHVPDGGKENRDELNWPVIKPYRKTINGRDSYHYFANGRLGYEDDFSDNRIISAADSVLGLAVDKQQQALLNTDSIGEAVFSMELPYVFVGGSVSGVAELVDGGWVAVYMDLGQAEQWVCLGVRETAGKFDFIIPGSLLNERYSFQIKVKLHGAHGPGSAKLRNIKLDALCQLNMYSLPFLAPGENNVTVRAGSIGAGTSLKVTYRWQEKGWDREHLQTVRKAPATYGITVEGQEYPRMKSIEMEAVID